LKIVVALVVGLIVVGATTVSLSQLSKAKARSTARQEAFARADSAASRIAADARRRPARTKCSLLGSRSFPAPARLAETDSILLWCRSLAPVRGLPDFPEGGDAEVQYRVLPMLDGPGQCAVASCDAPPDRAVDGGGWRAGSAGHRLAVGTGFGRGVLV